MSWKFVFNTTVSDKLWGNIRKASEAARDCGYSFFTWNGWVHHIDNGRTPIRETECF